MYIDFLKAAGTSKRVRAHLSVCVCVCAFCLWPLLLRPPETGTSSARPTTATSWSSCISFRSQKAVPRTRRTTSARALGSVALGNVPPQPHRPKAARHCTSLSRVATWKWPSFCCSTSPMSMPKPTIVSALRAVGRSYIIHV